jgi:hypothetical protein
MNEWSKWHNYFNNTSVCYPNVQKFDWHRYTKGLNTKSLWVLQRLLLLRVPTSDTGGWSEKQVSKC